jgi:hypothetical protein
MKMIPGPEGTPLGLEEGVAVNITEAASLEDTFIEEFDDLQVVVWIQDNETKYVLQSESSDLIVGIPENDERATFSFYPNPASHAIHIQSGYQAELVILDSQGRNVLTRQISRGQNTIDISNLKKGLYVIQMISEQMIKSQKLIVD